MDRIVRLLMALRLAAFHIGLFLAVACVIGIAIEQFEVGASTLQQILAVTLTLVPFAILHIILWVTVSYRVANTPEDEFQLLKKNTGAYSDSLWSLMVLVVMIVFSGLLLYHIYQIDMQSRKDAKERQEQQIPDAYDPTTWGRPTTRTPASGTNLNVTSTTTTEYELSYENLANGKVQLSTFDLDADRNNGAFGTVYFQGGVSEKCEPRPSNGYYTCEGFKNGMLKLVDLLVSPERSAINTDVIGRYGYEFLAGVGVFEYVDEQGTETIVMGLSTYGSEANTYKPLVVDRFEGARAITVEHVDRLEFVNAIYDFITIVNGDTTNRYAITTDFVRNGPVTYVEHVTEDGLISRVTSLNEYVFAGQEAEIIGDVVFNYDPRDVYVYRYYGSGTTDRYYDWSNENAPKMYFETECGMPYTFGDYSAALRNPTDARLNGVYLDINVAITQGISTLNLTTARYGYDPDKWGTITDTVVLKPFIDSIVGGIAFNGYATEQMFIDGVSIRHTLPRVAPRPCDDDVREQYQWVQNGNIYTLNVTYQADTDLTPEQETFIKTGLESVVRGLSYVPLE